MGFESYSGTKVPQDEDLNYNAQCTACSAKEHCDRILMQYAPLQVWDYAKDQSTYIYVSVRNANDRYSADSFE